MKTLSLSVLVAGLTLAAPAWATLIESSSKDPRVERGDAIVLAQKQSAKKKTSKGSTNQKQTSPDRGGGTTGY